MHLYQYIDGRRRGIKIFTNFLYRSNEEPRYISNGHIDQAACVCAFFFLLRANMLAIGTRSIKCRGVI